MENKTNPFKGYYINKEEANGLLIDKAINMINSTGGELSPANVSRITKEIDPNGITPSGISKNEKHKHKIFMAQRERDNGIQKL